MIVPFRKAKKPWLAIDTPHHVLSLEDETHITSDTPYPFRVYPIDNYDDPLVGVIVNDMGVDVDIKLDAPCPVLNFKRWLILKGEYHASQN